MGTKDYIIVTPCKNEEKNLLNLYNSLLTQTNKPTLWVIVDDGSTDSTPQIITEIQNQNRWILSIRLESKKHDTGIHVYSVYNEGFKYLLDYCEKNGISYGYIGNIDADMVLKEADFFQRMIEHFENNPRIGILSSKIYCLEGSSLTIERNRENLPMGSPRIWRKECFGDTGGYPLSYSADSVSNVIAKNKGWDVAILDTIAAIQSRKTSSASGLWKGYVIHGKSAYYRHYHILFVILKSIKLCFVNPYYIGIAYFYGFLLSIISKKERFEDKSVLNYYHKQKMKEALIHYSGQLNKSITNLCAGVLRLK